MTLRVIALFFQLRHDCFAVFTSLRDVSLHWKKSARAFGPLGEAEHDSSSHR